ncbi:MAG: acyl-CoA synthetase FdrA [Albidovulum sp.]|nr:acyl-CoA synthetase FdrA [Albidovulum sp.]
MNAVVMNEVRKGFYVDSVALMRISRSIGRLKQVDEASLMMGTPANREIMADAGLLADEGAAAGGGDLVIAVRAENSAAAKEALSTAIEQLQSPSQKFASGEEWTPRTLRSAVSAFPSANVALISVPGEFAAAEARKAIRLGLHAMIFSDNVSIAEEIQLKREAQSLGLLVMGPDCGTAIISGTPLAFANCVSRGPVGIVGASGTGIQEVSCQIERMGGGILHAIGVGGRDLKSEVGGTTTLMAIDALASDPDIESIVVISKPPGDDVAKKVIERLGIAGKPAVVCFLGSAALPLPANVLQAYTLKDAAAAAVGKGFEQSERPGLPTRSGGIAGLYSGGTLCAEAQVILRDAGLPINSNAPIAKVAKGREGSYVLLDLGDDEFTRGRPHPMIDPGVREAFLIEALGRDDIGVVLADVVIGQGAHSDPALPLADIVRAHGRRSGPIVISAVTGTEQDSQVLSDQESKLCKAGIVVASSNADAARWALAVAGRG